MSTLTTNYRLTKPASSDAYNISIMNNNLDTLDSTLKSIDNSKLSTSGGTISGDLTVTGNTNINGTITVGSVSGGLAVTGNTNVNGGLTVTGNTNINGAITVGSGFGKTTKITQNLTLSTSWQDTTISKGVLSSGAYIVHITGIYNTDMSWQNDNQYVGVMSWYSGETNASDANEIPLHVTGHAQNGYVIYLRTLNYGRSTAKDTVLQIKSSVNFTRATDVKFTFVKIV